MQLNALKRCVAAALATVLLSAVQLAQASYPFREMVNPPTHLSNLGLSSSCDTSYPTFALEPNDNQKHPLFILMPGTNFNGVNNDVPLNGSLYRIFLERMAERGFVAVVAEYDNEFNLLTFNDNGFAARAACMFDKTKTSSLINTLCSRSNVDCSLGIATSGHSQGGILALAASHYESRVSASDISGTADQNGPRADLPFNRIRLTNAENDGGNTINGTNASTAGNNSATGMNCSTSTNSCLRADGSGWVMVRQSQLLENNADHCWFFKTGCDANAPENIEPTWWDPVTQPNYDYSLIPRANWLAATAVAPRTCPSKYVALKSKVNGKYVSARLSTSGIPLQATASSAADWEKFACIEVGNGQVTLKAINGNFVTANAANGQKLEATNSVAGTAGTFNYITISGSTIALKGVSNGRYVDVKTNQSNQLVMDQSSAVTSATYEIIAK